MRNHKGSLLQPKRDLSLPFIAVYKDCQHGYLPWLGGRSD